jgi:hypothetical protein
VILLKTLFIVNTVDYSLYCLYRLGVVRDVYCLLGLLCLCGASLSLPCKEDGLYKRQAMMPIVRDEDDSRTSCRFETLSWYCVSVGCTQSSPAILCTTGKALEDLCCKVES